MSGSDARAKAGKRTPLPLATYREVPPEEMVRRAGEFLSEMRSRRSVRDFSTRPVPVDIVLDCVRTATTAPSGANGQPWRFVVVSDPATKRRIRDGAELVERRFYEELASPDLLAELAELGTGPSKPFLEDAPHLIAVFARFRETAPDGREVRSSYPVESVGIAVGLLIAAIHHAGLVTVPYTPAPMNFLGKILGRPPGERGFAILPVGYPARDARVPDIERRTEGDIISRA